MQRLLCLVCFKVRFRRSRPSIDKLLIATACDCPWPVDNCVLDIFFRQVPIYLYVYFKKSCVEHFLWKGLDHNLYLHGIWASA